MDASTGFSRLAQLQARFQQKQLAVKEQKMHELNEAQRTVPKGRGSAGSGSSGSSNNSRSSTLAAGKVRQMFDERRHRATGIDKSYPLQPLKSRPSPTNLSSKVTMTSEKTVVQQSRTVRNGVGVANRVATRTTTNAVNGNGRTIKETVRQRQVYNNENENDDSDGNNVNEEDASYEIEESGNHIVDQFELEALLNNHNINDSLEDIDFPGSPSSLTDDISEYSDTVTKLPNLGSPPMGGAVVSKRKTNIDNQKLLGGDKQNMNQVQNRVLKAAGDLNSNMTKSKYDTFVKKPNKGGNRTPLEKVESMPIKTSRREEVQKVSSATTRPPAAVRKPSPTNTLESNSSTKSGGQDIVVAKRKPVQNREALQQEMTERSKKPVSIAHKPLPLNKLSSVQNLLACKICGRKFAEDRIQKHQKICTKAAQKKRKVYDALKHRVQGTEAEQFVRQKTRQVGGQTVMNKRLPIKSNWRQKHEDFINAIRSAKKAQAYVAKGGKLSDLPPPPPSENPDYIQCSYCGRRFNQAAAERHIPKCATMMHNKPKQNNSSSFGKIQAGSSKRK